MLLACLIGLVLSSDGNGWVGFGGYFYNSPHKIGRLMFACWKGWSGLQMEMGEKPCFEKPSSHHRLTSPTSTNKQARPTHAHGNTFKLEAFHHIPAGKQH